MLGATSCAQAALPKSYKDYKWLLAIQDRIYPVNLIINIAKAPKPQVIHFDACLVLPFGDLSYKRQLSQEDKYLCPEGETSTNGQNPCLDWDGGW
jgi:hypothetical protein